MKNILKIVLILFSVQFFAQSNTTCATAELITLNVGQNLQVDVDTSGLPLTGSSYCGISGTVYTNLWYSFVMPVDGNVRITWADNYELFTLYDSCGGAYIRCFSGNDYFYSLTGGNTYYIHYSKGGSQGINSFKIEPFSAATNDTCATPENLVIPTNTFLTVDAFTTGSTVSSTVSSCENTSDDLHDLYYSFTMPVDGNIRITYAGNSENFTLYDACNGTEIKCFNGGNYFYSLSAGQSYILRFSNTQYYSDNHTFRVQAFPTALNDTCATPENLVIPTNTFLAVDAFTTGSTVSNTLSSCENASDALHDLYYSFTMPVDGNIRITYANNLDFFTLYDACNGTEIKCFKNTNYFYSLSAGQNYILRFSNTQYWSDNHTFRIQAFPTALNDTCATPENIVIPTNTFLEIQADTRASTVSNTVSSCENASDVLHDLYYSFTMPVDGNIRITYAGNLEFFTLYDACNGAEIKCFKNSNYFYSLSAGQSYILRFSNMQYWSDNHNFRIQAFPIATNDTCATPENIVIPTNTFLEVQADTKGSTMANTVSSCENASDVLHDLYYSFTMPVDGNIRITYASNLEFFTLYDACNGTEIKCFKNSNYFYSLSAGQNYILRFSNTQYWSDNHTFRIQAFPIASNDTCTTPENIVLTTTSYTEVTANNQKSSISSTLSSCENVNDTWMDLWYDFTMPVKGNLHITYASFTENFTLYNVCNGTEISCFNGDSIIYDLLAGTNYILRFSTVYNNSNDHTFRLTVAETAANNVCADAINLSVGVYDEYTETKTLFGATNSSVVPLPSCAGNSSTNVGVWFTVQVPASGNITIETDSATGSLLNDTVLQIFSGTCGALTEIACDDNSGSNNFSRIRLTGLNPTDTLYIRVFENGSNIADYYKIFAYDNFCDGATNWNGTIWSNGVPDSTKIAVFDNGYNTNTANIDACMCKIKAATVIVNSNQYVKLESNLYNDGNITLHHQASFVQVSDAAQIVGNGNFTTTIQTTSLLDEDRFTYLTSPVQNASLFVLNSWANMTRIWDFDSSMQEWHLIPDQFQAMEIARGYAIKGRSNLDYTTGFIGTVIFQGMFNTGIQTQSLVYNLGGIDDDNVLVGNPYPSAISIASLLDNTVNPDANSVYVWTHNSPIVGNAYENDDYIVCSANTCTSAYTGNDANNLNGFLASGQGFFVDATANGTLTFNNSMRVTGNNMDFRQIETNLDKIWINLESNLGYFSQIALNFTPNGTGNFDAKLDAKRLGDYYGIGFYSIGNNSERLAISDTGILSETKTIPLGLYLNDAQANILKISIDHFENLDGVSVILKDNLLNIQHDLQHSDYEFNPNFTGADTNVINNRFELIFSRNALAIDTVNTGDEKLLISTKSDGDIQVSTLHGSIFNAIQVYDLLGKQLVNIKTNSSLEVLSNINVKKGNILLFKVKLKNGKIINAKFIKE